MSFRINKYKLPMVSYCRFGLEISTDGGAEPMWRGDGKEFFYLAGDKVMAVDVKTGPTGLEVGVRKVLFQHPPLILPLSRNHYVVTRDGQRFLFEAYGEQQSPVFNVLTNWTAALKK